jgi:hypothetical protein
MDESVLKLNDQYGGIYRGDREIDTDSNGNSMRNVV